MRLAISGVVLSLAIAGCGSRTEEAAPPKPQVAGGWSETSVKDENIIAAANFAVKAQSEAKGTKEKPAAITLVEIVKANSQVVAGTNFRLTLRVKFEDAVKDAEAIVWSKLDGTRELTSWTWVEKPGAK